jgi:O-antigen ligase
MSPVVHGPIDATPSRRGPHVVVGIMLVLMPLVSIQGPLHTTPMDAASLLFLVGYWAHVLLRRISVPFPMLVPYWLILMGSVIGMFAAHDPGTAMIHLTKEFYLYLWFVSVAHFIARYCNARRVAATWVWIASVLAVLMSVDHATGAFGGFFSGGDRATGTFENPNMGGNFLVMTFFLAWALASAGMRRFYLALPACVLGCLATASNGAMLSLLVGGTVAGAMYSQRRLAQFVGIGLVLGGIGVVGLGGGYETLVDSFMDRASMGKRELVGGTAVEGAEERLLFWSDAIESIKSHPMGVGPSNFNKLGGAVSGGFHGAHNTYLGMMVERGPLGVLGWILTLGIGVAWVNRLRTRALTGAGMLAVEPLYGVIAAVAAHALVMEVNHFRHIWMFLAILYAAGVQASVVMSRRTRPAVATGV